MISTLLSSFVETLFPHLCTQCKLTLKTNEKLFCTLCFSYLELISLQRRCHRCFTLKEHAKECCDAAYPFTQAAAVFEHRITAAALLDRFCKGDRPDLRLAIAGFMVLQLQQLNWPKFDLIVSSPHSLISVLLKGYNHTQLIAEEVGKLLNCRVKSLLNYDGMEEVYWKRKPEVISDLTILLIDDRMSEKTREAGKVLREGFPKHLFALTFTTDL